jgi:hypothetical protein
MAAQDSFGRGFGVSSLATTRSPVQDCHPKNTTMTAQVSMNP